MMTLIFYLLGGYSMFLVTEADYTNYTAGSTATVDVDFGGTEMFMVMTKNESDGMIKLMFTNAGYLMLDLQNKVYQVEGCYDNKTPLPDADEIDAIDMKIQIDVVANHYLMVFFDGEAKIKVMFMNMSNTCTEKWRMNVTNVVIDTTTNIDLVYKTMTYKGCRSYKIMGERELSPDKDLYHPDDKVMVDCKYGCKEEPCKNETKCVSGAGGVNMWDPMIHCKSGGIGASNSAMLVASILLYAMFRELF